MSRARPLALAAVLAALPLASCQRTTDPAGRGRAYFVTFGCDRCHAVAGEGAHYGPDLTFVGFRKTAEWLDLWLTNPHEWKRNTVMPNLHLPKHVRSDLVAYLSAQKGGGYLQGPKPWDDPAVAKNPVARGKSLFTHLGCTGCHGAEGLGGSPNNNVAGGLIPTLRGVRDLYSKDELVDKIRQGSTPGAANPKAPPPMIKMPEWGKVLSADELHSLAAYLVTLDPVKGAKGKAAEEDF